mgnify:CR=1 FL=1
MRKRRSLNPLRRRSAGRKRLPRRRNLPTTRLLGESLELRFAPAVGPELASLLDHLAAPPELNATSVVAGRHLFYNRSAFDGNQPQAGPADDGAIAPDKQPLLPGQVASFANYSSYSRGINGLMVDIAPLADPGSLSAADFEFRFGVAGDPSTWQTAPSPSTIDVRLGEGTGGSDRVTLIWPDNAIEKGWLQVTVKATAATGLATSDVFYFGNLIGETGNTQTSVALVNAIDEIAVRQNTGLVDDPSVPADPYDFNRDRLITAVDQIIARSNTGFLQMIAAPEITATEVTIVAANLLELTAGSVEYLPPMAPQSGDPPQAILHDVTLEFTDLPGDLGSVSITLDEVNGYDDNADGEIDGFGLSTVIDLSNVNLSVGEKTLLTLEALTLGVSGLEIRPELNGGFRTGDLIFSASGVQLLPGVLGASLEASGFSPQAALSDPDVGSIDINTGAFSLSLDVPPAIGERLTISGWVPVQLTHVDAAFDPAGSTPDIDFALTGFVDATRLAGELGSAIGSPGLAVTVEAYDADGQTFAPTGPGNPLTLGVAYVDGEIRPTNTPAVKVDVQNIEVPLGATLGDLTLGGYIAVGGFDGFGLPIPMPAELGVPYAGEQVVGNLSVTSNSGIGQIGGSVTLGGSLASANDLSVLDLAGQATLTGDFDFSGVLASGQISAVLEWAIEVDNTTGQPAFSGAPTISNVQASDLLVTVPDLLTLDVGLIQYADPGTLQPGDPIAALQDATLTFTHLPGDLGTVAIGLGNVDGYDDNGDGLIDGFGLSSSISLGDVNLSVGEKTLMTLEALMLGINGVQVRPELDDGFRTGELAFSASGLQLLPGVFGAASEVGVFSSQEALSHPDVGSIDINTGAFNLSLDVPPAIGERLTISGWVPVQLTHVDAAFDPAGSTPDIDFALTGFVDATRLAGELGSAIGSPGLAVTVEAYDADGQTFAPTGPGNPLTLGVAYVDGEIRPTNTPAVKVDVQNIEVPLGATLGNLTLGGYIAVGGFDGFGLPIPMPAELGAPYAGEQVVGNLSVTSNSGIGQIGGSVTLGGSLASANDLSVLDLAGQATLTGDFDFSGVLASGQISAVLEWAIEVDNTTGQPAFSGAPTISNVQASDLLVTVPDLLTLDVGLIQYADPGTLQPGDPIAALQDATLTFTHLPGDLGTVAVGLGNVDGYDDNGDGLIDGFGLSTSISLGDVNLSVGEKTLMTLEALMLGINGVQVRPELNDGFRTGELAFSASGLQLLPGVFGAASEVGVFSSQEALSHPDVGSIDINTGAFNLSLDVPPAIGERLTISGWVPVQLTHVDAAFDPAGSTPDIDFALTGFVDATRLAGELGSAIGSPGLAVTVEAYDADGQTFAPTGPGNPLTLGVAYVDGEIRPTNTPAVKVDVQNIEVPLGATLGDLTLGGYIAVGGFDGFGLPMPMPAELGVPYAGEQVLGNLTVTSTSGIGQLDGTVTLGGSLASANGISVLDLTGAATLTGDLASVGLSGSGTVHGQFAWPITVDNTSGSPVISGVPELTGLQAESIVLEIEDVVRFDIADITYDPAPDPGDPVATATAATVTMLGILAAANLAGTADLALYDDDQDGIVDGVALSGLNVTFAPGQQWDYAPGGTALLRVSDLGATFSGLEYRPKLGGFETQGTISLALGTVGLYPDGGGAFSGSVNNATGSINPATGEVLFDIGQLLIGLGPDSLFQVDVTDATFQLDDSEQTDLLTVASAELRVVDQLDSLSAASFGITDFRFNVMAGQPKFGLGGIQLQAAPGVLGSLGLAGFLPLDVTDLGITFADDGANYTDFTDFTLSVDGYFNLGLIESLLPFDPVLSIGPTSAGDAANPHTFTDIEFGFDLVEGRIVPLNLSQIRVGFSEWAIGELVFAGEIELAGYTSGLLDPTVTGTFGIDMASANNRVQPSGGTGIDFYGAELALTGTIGRGDNSTSLVVDADVQTAFDLSLGDFLHMSDLGFAFGVDIDVPDNFLDDPLGLVSINPRLEEMTVGTLTASAGDFLSFGAVPGSGGGPGLTIDFDPGPGDPLALLNFNAQSPLIGLSGTVEGLAVLPGGVPDFDSIGQIDIELVPRGDGSASLLQEVFAEFLPLSISKIGLDFQSGFFQFAGSPGNESIVGIADPTALNLITSGRAGTPSWLPEDFLFEVGSDFSNLEIDLQELVDGNFPIVDLGGLGFELGVDLGAFKIGGAAAVGLVDADPDPVGEEIVYYLAIEGGLEVAGYGATGAIALTTAGPIGATLSVPLAIPLGQSGFVVSGAAGTIQFGTTVLPAPEDIQAPSDLGTIPNPFSIDLSSVPAIEQIVQGLWVDDPGGGYVRPLWTEPVTVALQGELTHVAVAAVLSGTATVAANLTLPVGGATIDDAGLALLGFGDIRALGIPLADAKVVFDLRDELSPSFGFYFQAPSNANPLGMLFPAQADFGVLLRTDGLAMATAIGLRSFFTELASGALAQGQSFFETVAGQVLDVLQQDPASSALADLLAPLLPVGTTFADLDATELIELLRDSLEFDDVLTALESGSGQTVEQLPQNLQDKLGAVIDLSTAVVQDVMLFGPQVIAAGLNDALSVGEQLVALGLRNPGQESDPVDPFGLLTSFSPENLAADRLIPLEFVSEFTSLFVNSLGSAVSEALTQTAAFVLSDSFDPRLLIEGSIQPTLLGVPVGEAPGGVQMTVSKRGVSFGFDASIARIISLLGAAPPLNLLMYSTQSISDETTIAYELPFDALDALEDLVDGGLPLGALNPFSPDWGLLAISQLNIAGITSSASMAQFGPGSALLENNVQIVDDFDDPVDPGKIPVTSQELLDRMQGLGGYLFTGGVAQAKLLADPFEVIAGILDAARQAGEELDDADGELAYLMQLFSTGPAFLEAVQDSLTQAEEFARVQAYLPVSAETLLPQALLDLLDGDPEAFNAAFQATYFDASGNIRDDAVQAVFDAIATELQTSATTIAANAYFEGLLNSKVLGIELANGRLFAGVLPDPDNPGATLDFGNAAVNLTGAIPWLGNLEVEAVLDVQPMPLPAPPVSGPDPLASLRAAFGDSVPLPRGRFELALDTAQPPGGGPSDFETVMGSLGLDPAMFQLPTIGQASAALRAYTPGYDLSSSVPIERVGGMEFQANLAIPDVVDNAEFLFRMSAPTNGPGGTYLPFTAKASVDEITLGGFTITGAVFDLVNDENGTSVHVAGTTQLLGATFTVDGELDSRLQGSLQLTLSAGAPNFGGLSGSGTFSLVLNGPTSGSVAFAGSLANIPGTSRSVSASGSIQSSGNFAINVATTNLTFGGISVDSATLQVQRISGTTDIVFRSGATSTLLGATFDISGQFGTNGVGSLSMATSGTPNFGGAIAPVGGSFTLHISPSNSFVRFSGTVSGVPGHSGSLTVNGDIQSHTDFSLSSTATSLTYGAFTLNSATAQIVRTSGTTEVDVQGSFSLLGATFTASGSMSTSGSGSLSMSTTGTPNFGGSIVTTGGSFTLYTSSDGGGYVYFFGNLSGIPGRSGSLYLYGNIQSASSFTLNSLTTSLTYGAFTLNSASIQLVRTSGTTNVQAAGSLSLLGATFSVSGSMSTVGVGTLSMTTSGTPNFGGSIVPLSGNYTFTLHTTGFGGFVSFAGYLLGIPGRTGSLYFSGEFDSGSVFELHSGTTTLALGGFFITSASVDLIRSGGVTEVQLGGTGSLLGTSFSVGGELSTSGSGTLTMSLTGSTPSFGGFSGNGSFELVLSSASSGYVSFDGSLTSLPGGIQGSLAADGEIYSSGSFSLDASATNLAILPGGFLPPARAVVNGSLSITGSSSSTSGTISASGAMRIERIAWSWNGRIYVPTYTTVVPNFTLGGFTATSSGTINATLSGFNLSGGPLYLGVTSASFNVNSSGLFRLYLDNPYIQVSGVFSSGTWTRYPGDISIDLNTTTNFERLIWGGASNLDLGGFTLVRTDVFVALDNGALAIKLRDDAGYQAQVRLPANLGTFDILDEIVVGTNGTFNVGIENVRIGPSAINVTATQLRLRRLSNSYTALQLYVANPELNLPLNKTVDLGSSITFNYNASYSTNLFNQSTSLLDFGSTFEPLAGEGSNMDFSLETTSSGWEFSLLDGRVVDLKLLPDTTLAQLQSFSIDHNGNFSGSVYTDLKFTIGNVKYDFFTSTLSLSKVGSTVRLTIPSSSPLTCNVGFTSMSLSGYMASNGTYSFSGSSSSTWTVSVAGYSFTRITGTLSISLSSSGFSSSFSGSLQFWNGAAWITLGSGTTSISQSGSGVLNGFSFGI